MNLFRPINKVIRLLWLHIVIGFCCMLRKISLMTQWYITHRTHWTITSNFKLVNVYVITDSIYSFEPHPRRSMLYLFVPFLSTTHLPVTSICQCDIGRISHRCTDTAAMYQLIGTSKQLLCVEGNICLFVLHSLEYIYISKRYGWNDHWLWAKLKYKPLTFRQIARMRCYFDMIKMNSWASSSCAKRHHTIQIMILSDHNSQNAICNCKFTN